MLSSWGALVGEEETPGLGSPRWSGVAMGDSWGEPEARPKKACELDVPYMFEQNVASVNNDVYK